VWSLLVDLAFSPRVVEARSGLEPGLPKLRIEIVPANGATKLGNAVIG
jgi:hypothetical protein